MKKPIPSRIRIILGIGAAIVLFSYLGYKAVLGIRELAATHVQFAFSFLFISFLCQLIGTILAGSVWSGIVQHLGVRSTLWFDVQVFCASNLARKVPGTIWYALGRVMIYDRLLQPKNPVVLGMVTEVTVMALSGFVVMVFGLGDHLIEGINLSPGIYIIGVTLGVSLFAFFAPRILPRITQKLNKEQDRSPLIIRKRSALIWLLGEVGVVCLGAGVVFFLIQSVHPGAPVPFSRVLGGWGLAVALGPLAMWLPADVGLKDGLMYLILRPILGDAFSALLTLTWRVWVSLLEILIGSIAAFMLGKRMGVLSINLSDWKRS